MAVIVDLLCRVVVAASEYPDKTPPMVLHYRAPQLPEELDTASGLDTE